MHLIFQKNNILTVKKLKRKRLSKKVPEISEEYAKIPKTHKKENSQTAKSEIVWGIWRECGEQGNL
jgi:hypothetical protein